MTDNQKKVLQLLEKKKQETIDIIGIEPVRVGMFLWVDDTDISFEKHQTMRALGYNYSFSNCRYYYNPRLEYQKPTFETMALKYS